MGYSKGSTSLQTSMLCVGFKALALRFQGLIQLRA